MQRRAWWERCTLLNLRRIPNDTAEVAKESRLSNAIAGWSSPVYREIAER